MKKNTNITLILIFFCLPFLLGCGGGAGGGSAASLGGMVVDSNYDALSGVTVVAGSKIATSQSDGTYNIPAISNGLVVISYTAPGYTTSYRKVTVSGSSLQVPLVILTPLDGKSTPIKPAGGIASNTNGSVKITIPSNTLDASGVLVSLTRVETYAAPYPPPTGSMFIAVIVYISPPDVDLDSNRGVLSIPNITGLADGTMVPFYHFNVDDCEWKPLPWDGMASIGVPSGSITAEVEAFGWTAAIVQYLPNKGSITGVIRDAFHGTPITNAFVWRSAFSTVTDSFGTYTLLNVPTGEATVEAIAPGYTRNFANVVVPVNGTINADINLTPVQTGTVVGNIFNQDTSDPISGARVVIQPSGLQTMTDQNGNYTLYNVPPPVSVDIYAYANGYLSNTVHDTLSIGNTITDNIGLVPAGAVHPWTDDFETNKGWMVLTYEASCVWQWIANPQSLSDSLAPIYVTLPGGVKTLPSPNSPTHCYWFGTTVEGTSPEGCYVGIQDPMDSAESGGTTLFSLNKVSGMLVSPPIDITAFAYANLSFWTWWELESWNIASGYDKMMVEVGTDPYGSSDWHEVGILNPTKDPDQSQKQFYLPYSSGGFNKPGAWVKHTFDLTPYVGKRIKIRFTFDSGDNKYNGFRGWFIDDVSVNPEQVSGLGISGSAVGKRPDRGKIKRLPR